jgi:hypothetical protein
MLSNHIFKIASNLAEALPLLLTAREERLETLKVEKKKNTLLCGPSLGKRNVGNNRITVYASAAL